MDDENIRLMYASAATQHIESFYFRDAISAYEAQVEEFTGTREEAKDLILHGIKHAHATLDYTQKYIPALYNERKEHLHYATSFLEAAFELGAKHNNNALREDIYTAAQTLYGTTHDVYTKQCLLELQAKTACTPLQNAEIANRAVEILQQHNNDNDLLADSYYAIACLAENAQKQAGLAETDEIAALFVTFNVSYRTREYQQDFLLKLLEKATEKNRLAKFSPNLLGRLQDNWQVLAENRHLNICLSAVERNALWQKGLDIADQSDLAARTRVVETVLERYFSLALSSNSQLPRGPADDLLPFLSSAFGITPFELGRSGLVTQNFLLTPAHDGYFVTAYKQGNTITVLDHNGLEYEPSNTTKPVKRDMVPLRWHFREATAYAPSLRQSLAKEVKSWHELQADMYDAGFKTRCFYWARQKLGMH